MKHFFKIASCSLVLFLVGCGEGPAPSTVNNVLHERFSQFEGLAGLELVTVEHRGRQALFVENSEQLAQVLYYKASLAVGQEPMTLSSETLARLLGAMPKGISGITAGGNNAGDKLEVYGLVTYVQEAGQWQPLAPTRADIAVNHN